MKRLLLSLVSLALFASFICHASSVSAQKGWESLGLYGGQVYDIAIDPDDPDKMFAGASYGDGLAVTTDGGANWGPVLTGQEWGELDGEATFRNTAVWAVKIAPSKDKNPDNNIVWAVHNYGISKSSSGGADNTWIYISDSAMHDDCAGCPNDATPDQPGSEQFRYCEALAIDPSDSQTVYVGTGGPNSTDKKGAVYKTSDGGLTWTKSGMTVKAYDPDPDNNPIDYDPRDLNNEFYSTVKAIAVHPTNSDIVWAVDFNDILHKYLCQLYLSTDGGQTWKRSIGLGAYFGESGLVVKPDEPNVVFVGTFWGIVRVEYDKVGDDIRWDNPIKDTYPIGWASGKNVRALAFDPQDPEILYAVLGLDSDFKLLKSLDGGLSFTQEYAHDQQLITLSPHPKNSDILFGGDRLLGVFKGAFNSDNYSWTSISKGFNAIKVNDIAIDPNDPDHVIVGTMAGVFEKQGDGEWSATAKLPYTEAFSVAFDPSDQDGSSFYAGAESRLAKTSNNGTSWTLSNNLGYPHYVNDIAIDNNDSDTLFVTTRYPGSVWKSTNGGNSLSRVLDSNDQFDFNTVVIDPNNSDIVYAGSGNYFGENVPGNIYKSTSAGRSGTWTPIFSNITALSLLIDPINPAVIYAGCGYSDGSGVPLFKSSDRGRNWVKSYEGIPGEPTRYAVWGSSQNHTFVSGHTGSVVKGGKDDTNILHYDGVSWDRMDIGVAVPIYDIWGSSGSDIHAVGKSGTTAYFNGSNWVNVINGSTEDLHSVWGLSGVNVYAVGNAGTILNYNGSTWTNTASPTTNDLFGIWGSDWNNIFAVGSHGTILRFNGTRWSIIWSGVTEELQSIWGTSANNIFAAGNSRIANGNRYYTILHYDGSLWSRMNTPIVNANRNGKLRSIWGSASNDVWAVGDDGIILHYNGASWSTADSGTPYRLYDIWGDGGNIVYAVGMFGTLLQNTGSGWNPVNTGLNEFAIWNPVTDLKFRQDSSGHRNLYASTTRQGVYVSPNEAGQWYSLGTPAYDVYALATGSCNIGTAGAALGGEFGWIYGQVIIEGSDQIGIENARVFTDSGSWDRTDANGLYVIPDLQPGSYNLTVQAKGYGPEATPSMVGIAAGAATPVFFGLDPVVAIPFTSATGRQMSITTVNGNLTSLNAIDPGTIADINNRPSNLIYGLLDMEISVANPGDSATVVILLPEPVPQNYTWFKYSTNDGWYDFSGDAEFNDKRNEVTLSFVDGGAGDDDQIANRTIIDPSGLGYIAPVDNGGGGGGGGGGGCFITTSWKF